MTITLNIHCMKNIVKISKIAISGIFAATLLSNCQSTKALSGADKASIRKVYVNTQVGMPEKPFVQTRGDIWAGALGGAVGGAIAGSNMSQEDQVIQYLNANKIRVDQMLRNDFIHHLKRTGDFTVVNSSSLADAQFDLKVLAYGIGQNGNAFSNKYRTVMSTEGILSKNGGNVVWKNNGICTAIDGDRPQASWDELFTQPATMRKHMEALTQATAYKLSQNIAAKK